MGELEADGEDGDSGLELDGLLVGVELGVVVDQLDLEGGAGEEKRDINLTTCMELRTVVE